LIGQRVARAAPAGPVRFLAVRTPHGVDRDFWIPRNMDGTRGPAAAQVEEFAARLREVSGLTVELWDERLTTVAAHKTLLEADLSRRKRKKVVDQLAAVYILQGYLDRMAGAGSVRERE
ncbi:MAG: Holliday junction resolvase RuvX, partial [Syntrophomonadaceae bacterium]|nr:Holliday junction resolvase RuvX [Syntrophomonadaceae bacterium]